ncbi:MAG TPA: hypothetical protein VF778_10615 [Xanthobacteraceae bacterium]
MPEDPSPPQSPVPGQDRRAAPRAGLARLVVRIIGVAIVVVAAALLYSGLRDRFVLPQCDSDRAKRTLADVLKEMRLEPVHYEPLTTVSSNKTEVICRAVLPLPAGGNVAIDYRFRWQGSQAVMSYSVSQTK